MVGNGRMRKNMVLIDYIKKNYGHKPFKARDPNIPDNIRGLIYKYLCISGNIPNATSKHFEQILEKQKCSCYTKKSFKLKEVK